MLEISRRNLLVLAGAVMGAGALGGCSGVGGSAAAEGTLRYAFWGNNIRQENYNRAFELMREEYPDIALAVEFADYDAFQERMTTQMAAGNVADIFWIPAPQVMTYHANGLYRPLGDVDSLDLSDYTDSDIADFALAGEHNTMPFGTFVPVVRYNATFADQDGVDLPDDWDWAWLAEFCRDYTENNPEGRRAMSYDAQADLPFEGWIRQHGEELWTENGRVGFSADNLAGWIEWWEDLRKAGATTSVSEQDGIAPSWEDVGDDVLLWFGNSNHIVDEAAMYPDYEFKLKHMPADAGAADGHQFLYFPRMAIYRDASEEQAELAGHVLTYCTSTVEMQEIVGLTMGVPPNPRVAAEYEEIATPVELEMLRIVAEDRDAERRPRHEAPPGSSTWREIFRRTLEEITLGDTSISAGAAGMIEEINRGIDRAAD